MSNIVAISTAPGIGGIGIIRISGKDAFKIVERIFVPKNKKEPQGYSFKYGNIVDPKNNKIIDEVLVSYFKEPKSYTTENMCEINSHGGNIVMQKILEICLENGAEIAEPGEFTRRAFLNGRIDLSQAESVIDIINAKTKKEEENAINQLKGVLAKEISKIKEKALEIMLKIEVSIDYPEYDIEEVESSEAKEKLLEIQKKLENLEESFEKGKIIKDGINVAIVGRPNAGKSSLLNNLLKEERAIVTEYEGTTRDTIEEFISINGIPIKIIDTAGIRNAKDEVEKIGIKKSKEIIKKADFVIAIFDATKKMDEEDIQVLKEIKDKEGVILLNKSDLKTILKPNQKEFLDCKKEILEVSVKENIGIEEIYNIIEKTYRTDKIKIGEELIITNVRHKNLINQAIENVKQAQVSISKNLPIDMVAINIKQMMENLGEITGDNVSEDIINEIFKKFCLGK